jgi:SAM-dependent methyltransferase
MQMQECITANPTVADLGGVNLGRVLRDESYLQHGETLVDRLRTGLVKREILKRLPDTGHMRVLDLGCGYHATYLRILGDRLAEGVGVDFQVSQESRRQPRLRFMNTSIEAALPELPSHSFDVVLLISALEHLWDPAESLRQCHRVLKPGGRLLVNVPMSYAKPLKMYASQPELWPMLVQSGFKPTHIKMQYDNPAMILFATAIR